ncbi:MAG: chemotaxis protein CheC [Anaerolineae bacterium]
MWIDGDSERRGSERDLTARAGAIVAESELTAGATATGPDGEQPVPVFAGTRLDVILERMANLAASSSAEGLSTMLGKPIRMTVPRLSLSRIWEVPDRLGGADLEAVGVYLTFTGDMLGQVMLILPNPVALRMIDMLLEQAEGTTTEIGDMERSALGEIGNVATSLFLNAIADATGMDLRPSPPAVMQDMVGAIMDVVLVSAGAVSDDVLLLEAEYHGPDRALEMYFWLMPVSVVTNA